MILTERVGEIIDWRKDVAWKPFEGPVGTLQKYLLIQKALHE